MYPVDIRGKPHCLDTWLKQIGAILAELPLHFVYTPRQLLRYFIVLLDRSKESLQYSRSLAEPTLQRSSAHHRD
jgi:hypothetical protein